ncbi:11152_t:CDS:2 [Entrophospora sp. SA101]|nr:247_t:CDS:2 [Entrophospora sp. SA101]CAJ0875908.1 11152_t:CDS:2 [Entrophospora sp. SA101]
MDKTIASSASSTTNGTNVNGTMIMPQAPFPQPALRISSQTDYLNSSSTYDFLYELVQKRVTTFTYLKQVHEGRIHWLNTVCLNKEDLSIMYENMRMKKRTGNFFVLGTSLAPILDITNPQDYVKALNVMLQEFDYHTNEHTKQKMKNFLRKSKIVKDDDTSFQDTGEYNYLFVPNIPFDLDYFQTFYTLCDILVEVYNKLLKIVALITKEIDSLARNTLKEELKSIDPMIILSNLGGGGSNSNNTGSVKSTISSTSSNSSSTTVVENMGDVGWNSSSN